LDIEPVSKLFQLRASPAFFRSVDEFRRAEPDLPPRAEAIRRLCEQALKANQESPASAQKAVRHG
jgi:hypothetical protein